jgi:protein involved in polysaccharide export with SLBB domain
MKNVRTACVALALLCFGGPAVADQTASPPNPYGISALLGNLPVVGTSSSSASAQTQTQSTDTTQTQSTSTTQTQSGTNAPQTQTPSPTAYPPSRMFGAQLFNGSFRSLYGGGFNPNYQIAIGDRLQVKMWGAFNFEGQVPVDPQGNIFLPNIGPVAVAGVRNGDLNEVVKREAHRVFKANVEVYASLDVSQPVKVFVTGFVRQPGLYAGIASESPVNFLDRAGGVDPDRGSYLDVVVKRANQVRKRINLYNFLLNGELDFIQLQDGDAIVVGPREHTFSISGDVYNAYDFEFDQPEIPLEKALAMAKPKPDATHVSIIRQQGARHSEYHPISEATGVTLHDGDILSVTSDRYAGTIQVRVEGAHSGQHALVLPYGATMQEVLDQIRPNDMSRLDSIQLYRKSVAERQKQMLNVALSKLEEAAYSARSQTSEEATLRTQEAALLSKFVEKARAIEPTGQVILDQHALGGTLLEDGDTIVIPEKTSVVMVHGEVLFPSAVSWRSGLSPDDYIRQVGGYTQSADTSKAIVLHQNGEAVDAKNANMQAGDEIMVLPKIETKNIEVTRGITQILYQIAISAKVLFGL